MTIKIRKGGMQDIGELIELLYELFSIESDFSFDKKKQYKGLSLMLENEHDGNKQVWVAELDGRIVGMCTLQILISTAEGGEVGLVEDVVVKKHFRGRKVGRALLAAMESWAAERGLLRLQLLTDCTNLSAIQFYEKMDWQYTRLICMRKK